MSSELITFFILAFVAVFAALMMLFKANPVTSALFLILNFVALAGLYLTLSAQFIAIIQILVYAGAIMVLVLFVIMLLNLQDEKRLREAQTWKQYIGIVFTAILLIQLIQTVSFISGDSFGQIAPNAKTIGTVEYIGNALYTSFLFPFELASVLLLAAIIGAVLLAKKRFP